MEALTAYMTKTGQSYRDIAALLKVDVSMVHRMAKGKRKPGIKLARLMAIETGIPLKHIRPDVWGKQ